MKQNYDGEKFGNENLSKHKHTATSRILTAILFILAGSILIAERTGAISNEVFHFIFNWQMLLIALGIVSFFKKGSSVGGMIMILIGTVFLIPEYIQIPFNTQQLLWPAILICVGFIILFKGLGNAGPNFTKRYSKGTYDDIDIVDANHIFGGGDYHISSENFKGGRINAIFGGGKYDFRNAKLAPGIQYLDVSMIFGGLEINIPADCEG